MASATKPTAVAIPTAGKAQEEPTPGAAPNWGIITLLVGPSKEIAAFLTHRTANDVLCAGLQPRPV